MNKIYLQKFPIKLCAAVAFGTVVLKNFTESSPSLKAQYASNYSRKYYPASSEYPEVKKNRNIMSRNLTENVYAKLRDLRTPNGFTIDDAIQTGVDNRGKFGSTGIVAGDEQSYKVFNDLFDKIIYEKHGYTPEQKQINDLDGRKLTNAVFDYEYVLSIRVRMLRNISGYCFPSFCTRGERRDVESILVKTLYGIDDDYHGVYYSIKDLSEEEEATLNNNNVWMERPFLPEEVSANLARDWPDARGIWLSNDSSLAAFINRRDHIVLSAIEKTNDFKQVFDKFTQFINKFEKKFKSKNWKFSHNSHLGYLTTDPKDLGTALKMSVRIKLPNLSKDSRVSALLKMLNLSQTYRIIGETQHRNILDEEEDKRGSIFEITSKTSLGKSEVEIAQDFINSINELINVEKRIANGQLLDDILYKI